MAVGLRMALYRLMADPRTDLAVLTLILGQSAMLIIEIPGGSPAHANLAAVGWVLRGYSQSQSSTLVSRPSSLYINMGFPCKGNDGLEYPAYGREMRLAPPRASCW